MEKYEEKLRVYFKSQSIWKDPKYSEMFKDYGIPSYMRDWLIKRYSNSEGGLSDEDFKRILKVLNEKVIAKSDETLVKKLKKKLNDGENVKILTEMEVDIDFPSGKYLFRLPLINFPSRKGEGIIDESIVSKYEDELLKEKTWGVITLRLMRIENKRYVFCEDFKPFKPYKVSLDYFRRVRQEFTTKEWLDVIVSAMDYNPRAFREDQKLWLITRLFPFVEKNYNLIELAPKGTGKSYVYSRLSKYGWMISGGVITRAKLFYDMASRRTGVLTKYDYIAIDEIQTVKLKDPYEMVGVLKDYLESGTFRIGNFSGNGDAGFVILGNIPKDYQDINRSILDFFPEYFKETAFLDRFHAFLPGWMIPRMKENLKAKGWALNTEYFSEILHLLRSELAYRKIVDELLEYPAGSDTRDVKAVKKSLTACLKILFPHVMNHSTMSERILDDFRKLCFEHAKNLRKFIRYQMALVDREYERTMPEFSLRK
ncbi:MAG: BREX system Lon protease-like protein BrxL [Thermotoga sp.]|nr:MAG: BREX system Lon protease-like protein BrxL [Thermotoga sp.]